MVIQCSSCQARFKIADDKVKPGGTKVRCTKCREVFTVLPQDAAPVLNPANLSVFDQSEPAASSALIPPPPAEDSVQETFSASEPDPNNSPGDDDWFREGQQPAAEEFSFNDKPPFPPPVDSPADASSPETTVPSNDAALFAEEGFISFPEIPGAVAAAPLPTPDDGPTAADEDAFSFDLPEENLAATGTDNDPFADSAPAKTSDDLSTAWDEEVVTAPDSAPPAANPDAPASFDDFDFSSFSFDEDEKRAVASDPVPPGLDEEPIALDVEPPPTVETVDAISLAAPAAATETQRTPSAAIRPPLQSGRNPAQQRRSNRKKNAKFPIVKVLIIGLLICVALLAFWQRQRIRSEFNTGLEKIIDTQATVDMSGKITIANLSGGYLHSARYGDLFVIRGIATNEYKHPRASILVRGAIFDGKEKLLQEQNAYCGNVFTDKELADKPFDSIREAMASELGESLTNLSIAPNKGVPFMIVFRNVPKNISEFTAEVIESKPGAK